MPRHLILFVLGLTPAQQPGGQPPAQDAPAPQWTVQGPKAQRALAEDIEIMRRLLNRELLERPMLQCASCHGGGPLWSTSDYPCTRNFTFSKDGQIAATSDGRVVRMWDAASGKALATHPFPAHGFGPAEGFYLKGHGVIYTLTLPPPVQDPRGESAKPAPKPVSEWELIRRQMRGEKPTPAQRGETKPPALGEVILRVLARHGHNFKQLGPRENLSVVVIFRQPAGTTASAPTDPMGMGNPGGGPGKGGPPFSPPPYPGGASLPQGPMGGQPAGYGYPGRDYELSGDLHLKQNRIPQAIQAYEKALASPGLTATQTAGLYHKLAQAFLSVPDTGKGDRDKIIAKAIEFLQKAVQPGAGKPSEAALALPARLIVSAPKALLDAVGSGKLTFEEFRREATVQLDSAPTLEKGSSGGSK